MHKPSLAMVVGRTRASMVRFRDDEGGAMSLIFIFTFLAMILFGGIAIDVMRFETRRVAMQQTLDRAALAAASLTQTRTPQEVVNDYFAKANLEEGLFMVDFAAPTVTSVTDAGLRRVSASAQVTSTNFFMGIFSPLDNLTGLSATRAEQGVSQIEVMLVLDITGSMSESAGGGKTKIQAMRDAANQFVDIVKANDKKNGVSIGVVPYAAQVNIPAALRNQYTVQYLSSWDGVAGVGVPGINCFEFPTAGFSSTAVSQTTPIPMAAVADAASSTTTSGDYVAPQGPSTHSRACTANAETNTTAWNDAEVNQVLLPTKDANAVKTKISRLTANGNTYIAVGMRWATALLDEAARPIYDVLRASEPGMAGRPADNDSIYTRKIIILMTDGEHVTNNHIVDAFKTGLSPIYRGESDGRFAIRFTTGGPARTGGTRPACAGANTFFVPHLKPNSDTTCNSASSAGRVAWLATPEWPGSGTVRQLDWSEVWRYVRVTWVAQQLYARSNVTGASYSQALGQFRATYLTSVSNMNSLLQTNCTAAKNEGIEIYGIAFAAPTNGQTQIRNCATNADDYYFQPTSGDDIAAVFQTIATQIQDLRLTQ